MDFQTLNRRELQALCKLNRIPANITNIAMADALSSLETVEGIEEFLNASRTKTVGLSVKSPIWKKVKTDHNEVIKTPLVSCTRKKEPETSSCHLKECQHIAKKQFLVNHGKNCMPDTPVVGANYDQMKVTETVQKETTVVETTFSARRSTRLAIKRFQRAFVTSKEDLGKPLQEKHDVVLDESDENSKIEKVVHVDTITLESREKKVDCGDADSLKVKLEKIFGQVEDADLEERQNDGGKFDNFGEKSSHVDNLSEPLKLYNHNVAEIMNAEGIEENISGNKVDFVNLKKQNASMIIEGGGVEVEPQESLTEVEESEEVLTHSASETAGLSVETSERVDVNETPLISCTTEKALTLSSCHDLVSQLVECEDIASLVSAKKSEMRDVMEVDTSEAVKIDSFLDENIRIEKFVHVDTIAIENGSEKVDCCGEVDNLNMKSVQICEQIENVDLQDSEVDFVNPNKEGPLMVENDVEVTHDDESRADVAFVEEENHQISINEIADDMSKREDEEVMVSEENNEKECKSSLHGNSLRQLKKRLKATLISSPIAIRIQTELSDNKENSDAKEAQAVVAEEKADDKSLKNKNNINSCSLRQLKRKLKATYKDEKVNIF